MFRSRGLGALQVLSHERGQVNRVGVDGHRGDSFSRAFAGAIHTHGTCPKIRLLGFDEGSLRTT
jgi:hypothetical protein